MILSQRPFDLKGIVIIFSQRLLKIKSVDLVHCLHSSAYHNLPLLPITWNYFQNKSKSPISRWPLTNVCISAAMKMFTAAALHEMRLCLPIIPAEGSSMSLCNWEILSLFPSSDYFSQLRVQNRKIFAFRRLASLSEGDKKSPFEKFWKFLGKGWSSKIPLERKTLGGGGVGSAYKRVFRGGGGVWIFSGVTQ